MSSAELKQLSRINDKLDDGFDSLGGKLDWSNRRLDQIANEQRVQGAQLRKLIDGQERLIDGQERLIDGQERLIDGQERIISLLEGMAVHLEALVVAQTTVGAP